MFIAPVTVNLKPMRHFLIILSALVTAFVLFTGFSGPHPAPAHEYLRGGDTLRYRLFVPEKKDTLLPLLLFLHGAGERGSDNEKQLIHGKRFLDSALQQKHPCIVLAPQCPNGKRWVEVSWKLPAHTQPEQPSEAFRLLIPLLDSLIKNLPVDTNRIYVTGLSMGGFGTWDLLQRYPDKFAAAVPVCGGGDETKAKQIAHIPVWVFHGAKDKVVIPERSRNMVKALKKAGGKPRYTEYPTLQHNCWDSTYTNPKLYDWLFARSRRK